MNEHIYFQQKQTNQLCTNYARDLKQNTTFLICTLDNDNLKTTIQNIIYHIFEYHLLKRDHSIGSFHFCFAHSGSSVS